MKREMKINTGAAIVILVIASLLILPFVQAEELRFKPTIQNKVEL